MSLLKKASEGGETIIAEGVKVEGDFTSNGNVVIEGCVKGTVSATGDIRVCERAEIDADVSAHSLFASGILRGNVRVEDRLELSATSKVDGDIETKILQVASGAEINGKILMHSSATTTREQKYEKEAE